MKVGAILHNYVINSDQLNFLSVEDTVWETIGVEALPNGPEGNKGYLPIFNNEEEDPLYLNRREFVVNEIGTKGLTRPESNIERNN